MKVAYVQPPPAITAGTPAPVVQSQLTVGSRSAQAGRGRGRGGRGQPRLVAPSSASVAAPVDGQPVTSAAPAVQPILTASGMVIGPVSAPSRLLVIRLFCGCIC